MIGLSLAFVTSLFITSSLAAPAVAPRSFQLKGKRHLVVKRADGSFNAAFVDAEIAKLSTKYGIKNQILNTKLNTAAVTNAATSQSIVNTPSRIIKRAPVKKSSGIEPLMDEITGGLDEYYYGSIAIGRLKQFNSLISNTKGLRN